MFTSAEKIVIKIISLYKLTYSARLLSMRPEPNNRGIGMLPFQKDPYR